MGKITDVQIRHWIKAGAPLAKAQGEVPGLTFTLSSAGVATWILRYRFGGKPRELTLGRYPEFSIAGAKSEAMAARLRIQQGVDVAREKQQTRIDRAAAKTFRELATDYMDKVFPTLADNTVKQRRLHIDRRILPRIGGIAAREVDAADVVSIIEKVGQDSISVAELVFTAISEICKHGIARHVLTANPCHGISVAAVCGRAQPKRQRINLSEAELRAILPALPGIGAENALAVKIQLATCVRIGELAKARWEHIDFERREWFIPDANVKTRNDFTVPLTAQVIAWFKELQPLACGSAFVLPARNSIRRKATGGDTHYAPRALNAMLHKLCDDLGDKTRRFTPHDLRSTARSHLGALGVDVLVAERCLNHSLGGLVAVYDRHDYMTERRAALETWGSFLTACESGKPWKHNTDNVVPFRAAS